MENLYRRNQILDIINKGNVLTQAQLRRALAQRGIHVTQATVSRDIEELGLVKTREGYRLPGAPEPATSPQPTLSVILKEFLREVRLASNLVVVKTHPGNAHTVAVGVDSAGWAGVGGGVAGGETMCLGAGGGRGAGRLRRRMLGG